MITKEIAQTLAVYQEPQSGVWYQVMDVGKREGNYLESSASVMFTYFLLKSVQKGYINASYRKVAERGYEGILKQFIRV